MDSLLFFLNAGVLHSRYEILKLLDREHYANSKLLGYSIRSYRDDENIPLLVNKAYSDNTQLTYAYYDLPFVCPPSGNRIVGPPD